jgi:hypothetical protein
VVKPVSYTQFIESVRALGFFWTMANQGPPPAAGRG